MARKKPSITGSIRARQREGRERRRHVDKFPTKLPGAGRILDLVQSGELRWYALLDRSAERGGGARNAGPQRDYIILPDGFQMAEGQ